jgi:ribosomal protein L14
MIILSSKLTNKDNLQIKKLKCISTFKKKKASLNCQFKAVIIKSNSNTRLKGRLINALLATSKKNRQ